MCPQQTNVQQTPSRNPLVQVMLQFIEPPEANLRDMQGPEIEILSTKSESSKRYLSFYLHRTANRRLQCLISYATDLFNADRIQRISSHLPPVYGEGRIAAPIHP